MFHAWKNNQNKTAQCNETTTLHLYTFEEKDTAREREKRDNQEIILHAFTSIPKMGFKNDSSNFSPQKIEK